MPTPVPSPAPFPTPRTLLSDELLEQIRGRAAGYDRDNAFFTEDLAALTEAGYLRALVPESFGGAGLTLREVAHEQARLAGAAPATALAVNMHHVWTGVARYLHLRGDASLDWLLEDAVRGGVFGFGYSEGGNDLVLLGSRTEARPDERGGYTFHGRKIFTSNSPAWTRLGVLGLDTQSRDAPRLVHAFVSRDAGVQVLDDWDTMGMRASQSRSTVLDGAFAPVAHVGRRLAPGRPRGPGGGRAEPGRGACSGLAGPFSGFSQRGSRRVPTAAGRAAAPRGLRVRARIRPCALRGAHGRRR